MKALTIILGILAVFATIGLFFDLVMLAKYGWTQPSLVVGIVLAPLFWAGTVWAGRRWRARQHGRSQAITPD